MVDPLIIGAIVVGALSAASYYQQRKMQRQAEKQANEMASHQISGHDSNRALYTVYGRALIGTTTIYKRVSRRNIPMANANFTNFVGGGGSPSTESKTYGLNRFLYRISSLCNGPINGIENVLIDGEKYTANRFTAGHTKHFESAVSLGPTAGNHFANLRTSYATDFSAWGADKKGQGVAYVVERFWFDKSKPAYQGEPQTQYLVKGRSLYDPRLDSTVTGGSGSHRSDTPSTWTFSDNPALALLDMLTNDEYGRGVSHADCNMATFITAANKCDTLVDIPARATNTTGSTMVVYDPHTGTTHEIPDNGTISNYRIDQVTTGPNANKQKRFRLNMAVDNSKEVLDNIQQILQSFRGNLHHINGEYVVHMDDVASPVLTLTDDDIIGGLKIAQGDRKQRINRMTVKFLNANKHYKTDQVSWPPIDSDSSSQYQTYLTADSGEKLHKTVTLTGCTDYYQAEDIAEYLVRESRVTLAVSGTFGSRCFNLVPGDVIALTYDSAGYSGKYFIVDQVGVDVASMNVKLSLREYDSSVYTWNTARGNEPVALYFDEEQQYNATPTSLTLGTVSSAVVTLADGTATVSLVVPYSGVPEEATAVEVGWAPTGTSDYTTNVMQEDATKTKFQLGIDNQDIDIRVRYIVTNADGLQMPSGYTSTTFTLPAVSGTRLDGMEDNATNNTGVLADRDTVDTIHIEADAVTAAKILVTDIAAINADLGAITSGSLRSGNVTNPIPTDIFTRSSNQNIPTGTENGAFVDLDNGRFVFGDADSFISFADNSAGTARELDIKGVLAPTELDFSGVSALTVMPNTIKASGYTDASIGKDALSEEAYNEIASRLGNTGGFYETGTGFYLGSTKYITLANTPTHGTQDVTVRVAISDVFTAPAQFVANSNGVKVVAKLFYKLASDTNWNNQVQAGATQTFVASPTLLQYATRYTINASYEVTLTSGVGQNIADNTNYDFRVELTRLASPNAFQAYGSGGANDTTGTPVTLEVREGSQVVAGSGNATTLDNLDSSQFLRSDTSDTLSGDLTITGALHLQGDLNITGDLNSYNVTDLDVSDRTITVNSGGGVTTSDGAGLIIDRGTSANAEFTWNETNDVFDINNGIQPSFLYLEDQNGSVTSLFGIYGWDDELQFTKRNLTTRAHTGTLLALDYSTDAATFAGVVNWSGGSSTNANTAYSWGDHSTAGYLTSFTESDPTVPSHVKSITTTNISNWNTAYGYGNHATQNYAYTTGDTFTGTMNFSGDARFDGNLYGLYQTAEEDHYYFDSYSGSRNINSITKNQRSDIIRYQTPSNFEYWNGSSWVAASSQLANVKLLLDGRQDTSWSVPSTYYKFRFEVTANTGWPLLALIGAQTTWTGSNYPGYTMTVEEKQADNTWQVKTTANFTSANGFSTWGTAFIADSALHTGLAQHRITIDFYGWTPSNSAYNTIPLQNIFIMSNYAGTENTDYTNLLDFDRNVTIAADLKMGSNTVIASTRRFYASDGTNLKPAYAFDSDSNTGMYKYGADQIGFTAGGNLMAYIQSGATYGLVVQSKISATGGNSDNWNTAYTYSQVGHLPLAGGTITGRVTFPTASSTKPILAEGFFARTTGDTTGTHDIWGISGQYYPSATSSADRWGIQWSGSPNEINFIGAGQKKLSIDLDTAGDVKVDGNRIWDAGDFTSTNISNWNTAYGWGNHASAGYVTTSTANTFSALQTFEGTDDANFRLHVTSANGGWDAVTFQSTTEWGDGTTKYGVLGGDSSEGIMLRKPHIVWSSASSEASIRLGRSGGVSTGKWVGMGVGSSNQGFLGMESVRVLTWDASYNVQIPQGHLVVGTATGGDGSLFRSAGGWSGDTLNSQSNVPLVVQATNSDTTVFGALNHHGYQAFAMNIDSSANSSTQRGKIDFYTKTDGTFRKALTLDNGNVTSHGNFSAPHILHDNQGDVVFNLNDNTYVKINNPDGTEAIKIGGGGGVDAMTSYKNDIHRFYKANGTTTLAQFYQGIADFYTNEVVAGGLTINKASESLTNQPSHIATFDSTGTDGLALIRVQHDTVSTAAATGAGIEFRTGEGTTGSAKKSAYIFQRGAGNTTMQVVAPHDFKIFVDGHDNDLTGTTYTDYGTLALTIADSSAVTVASTLTLDANPTWSKKLKLGGDANNSDANTASIGTTNGNLHIDAALGAYGTYLNFYDGTGGVYIGTGTSSWRAHFNTSGGLNLGSAHSAPTTHLLSIANIGIIDSSRNLSSIGNISTTGIYTSIHTSQWAPNDGQTGIRLEYSGGDAPNDLGSGITFAQRWWSGATTNVRTGGIVGFKSAGSGSFGGGLKLYTQPQSGANMNVALQINHTQTATFYGLLQANSRMEIAGSGTANIPTLRINVSNANTFIHATESFAGTMTTGQTIVDVYGRAGSTKNSGYIGYYWHGSGSNSNFVSIGHWGANHQLRVYGDGTVDANTGGLATAAVVRIDNSGNATLGTISAGDITSSSSITGSEGTFGTSSGANVGIRLLSGTGSSDYARIRYYEGNLSTNRNTIHFFGRSWQGGGLAGQSTGAINLDGDYGVTFGAWNNIDAYIDGNGFHTGSGRGYYLGSTNIVDSSGNLSNIGTATFNGAVTLNSSLNVASTIGIAGTTVIGSDRAIVNARRLDFSDFAIVSTSTTTDNSMIRYTNLGPNPEGSHVSHPYFFNDLAHFGPRGGVVTTSGLNFTPVYTECFRANGRFVSWSSGNYTGSTMTITLTSLPHGLSYGGYIGIAFGNAVWAPTSCKIEVSTDGGSTWTTRLNNTSHQEIYFTSTGAGGTAVNAIRFTLGTPQYTSIRITHMWAYNYNSNGMADYFLSADGGTVRGNVGINTTTLNDTFTIYSSAGDKGLTIHNGGTASFENPTITFIDGGNSTSTLKIKGDAFCFSTYNTTDAVQIVGNGGQLKVNAGSDHIRMAQFSTNLTNNEDWQNSPITIRERDLVVGNQSADKYAPNINFHWAGRVSKSFWMGADGDFYIGEYSSSGVPQTTPTQLSRLGVRGLRIGTTEVIDQNRNFSAANVELTGIQKLVSGTGGTTNKLIFKTSDNADENKFIRTNAYYMEFGGHANEGFKFTDTNSNNLLSIFGGNNTYAQRVGINTITPQARLHVSGNRILVSSTSSTYGQLRVANTSNAETSIGFFAGATESTLNADNPSASQRWAMGLGAYTGTTSSFNIGNVSSNAVFQLNSVGDLTLSGVTRPTRLEASATGSNGSNGITDAQVVAVTGSGQSTVMAQHTADGHANLNLASMYNGDRKMWHISKRLNTDSHKLSFFWFENGGFAERFQFATNGTFTSDGGYNIGSNQVISSVRRFYASSGTEVKQAYSFDGDSGTGMYQPAAGSLGWSLVGDRKLLLNTSGSLVVNPDGANSYGINSRFAVHQDTNAAIAQFTASSANSTYGPTVVIGDSAAGNTTLIDTNKRAVLVLDGQYPAINLNCTNSTNDNHGATLQFTANNTNSNRQAVIGANGTCTRIDFGFAGGSLGAGNTNNNPHNGIAGYSGTTIMRVFDNGVAIGSLGSYPNEISSVSNTLSVYGTILATSNITAYSDKRLKENIETLDGSKVYEMRGVSFTKDGEAGSGVVAQELEAVAPELVHDGEYKSVAYGNLVGYLIEAIKDQKELIDNLTQRIEELENGNH